MRIRSHALDIVAITSALPERVLTNEDLAARFGNVQPERIFAITGVRQRHYVAPDQTATDLAAQAANTLFESGAVTRQEVDFLIFSSETPDYRLPASSCVLQDRLGLPVTCAAFDVNLGCSGWVYALGIAQGLLSSGLGRVGLILTAETPSRYVHPYDRSTAFLFGDAATATLVRVAHDGAGLQHLSFGTDGAGAGHVMIPAGGMRLPRSAETAIEHVDATGNVRSQNELYMNGPEVLNFTLSRIPGAIRQCLEEAALGPEDIDLWVLHQASDVVLSALQRKFRVAPERMAYRLADVGNTVGSATPLALQAALLAGKVRPGARVLVAGFGVGLSWAVGLLVWPG